MATLTVRAATVNDVPRVVGLVTGMFHDLGTTVTEPGWEQAAGDRLATDPGIGTFVTVDDADRPIAVAVGVVDRHLPSPRRPRGLVGYLEWLATDARWRRRGAARLALAGLLDWFDAQSVPVVDVHASAAARPLYDALGFRPPSAVALRRYAPARSIANM